MSFSQQNGKDPVSRPNVMNDDLLYVPDDEFPLGSISIDYSHSGAFSQQNGKGPVPRPNVMSDDDGNNHENALPPRCTQINGSWVQRADSSVQYEAIFPMMDAERSLPNALFLGQEQNPMLCFPASGQASRNNPKVVVIKGEQKKSMLCPPAPEQSSSQSDLEDVSREE